MFLYEKKIVYLSLYESEEKICSAGFASLSLEKEEIHIIIQIRNVDNEKNCNYPIWLLTENQRINIGVISAKAGQGSFEKKFDYYNGEADINHLKVEPDEICGIEINLFENRTIEGKWKATGPERKEILIRDEISEEPMLAKEPDLKAVSIAPDKWEQLKNQFKIIHPFGDEREFISLEIKDFTVLREAYQRLVNNSFLLHGFYNYRHLILGKDYKIGTENEICFYLGVPGVFFEREKMVAVMFGFEGFESAGPVEIGKFGYYLRRVEI